MSGNFLRYCIHSEHLYGVIGGTKISMKVDSSKGRGEHNHGHQHRFCATCGIHVFGEGTAPDGKSIAAVNIRCLEGINLASAPVTLSSTAARSSREVAVASSKPRGFARSLSAGPGPVSS